MAAAEAPARHQSLHQLRASWRPRLSFCGRSAHFSVELAARRTSLCTAIPFQPERTFLPLTACQPSVSPRDRGKHVDANKTSTPHPALNPQQKRFHVIPKNRRLAANLKLPTSSADLNHAPWSVTNCLPEQKQRFWPLVDLTFFPPWKLRDLFCRERMKHENRPIVQFFVST